MAKVEVLKYNRKVMTPLGIYSHRLTEPTNEFYSSIVPYYFICFDVIFLTISSAVFSVQNISAIRLALQNVTLIVAGMQCAGMFISIGINMKKVKLLHLKLQGIVNAGGKLSLKYLQQNSGIKMTKISSFQADHKISDIYWNNEQKCRKYTKTVCCYILFHMQVFVAAFFYPMYCMYVGNFDASTWPLPFNYAVPFDETTFWGYYLMWFIQANSAMAYCLGTTSTTSYFMACCLYIGALCDHFDSLAHSVDGAVEQCESEMVLERKLKLHRKINEYLVKVVKHHVETLE